MMLRWFKIRKDATHELSASKLYDADTFYQAFARDLHKCKKELIIESPFLTKARVDRLTPIFQRLIAKDVGIVINTRPSSEQDIVMAAQSELAINTLLDMGIKVLFTGGHHRKLAIIDRQILWEGSLNILSQRNSCEIMRKIDSSCLAEQMISYIKLRKYLR
jgi:phosphatidylserine/phosphatidylglycerophosphate/cardiolipin synthase-like enzyme